MFTGSVRIIALGVALLALMATTSAAFEGAYEPLMPKEKVLAIAKSRGLVLRSERPSQLPNSNEEIYWFDDSSGSTHYFSFCKSLLSSMGYDIKGAFREFIRLMDKYTIQYGVGEYKVISDQTQVGEWNALSISWQFPIWEKTLLIGIVADQRPQVSISWAVKPSLCGD